MFVERSQARCQDLFIASEPTERFTKARYWQLTAATTFRTILKIWRMNTQVCFSLLSFRSSNCVDCATLLAKPQPVTAPLNVVGKERVRKSPPLTTSEETSVTIKRPKTETAGSRGRTRLSDFDELTKSLADETISIYQAQIITVQAWPSSAENLASITQAWIEVCTSRNVRIDLDEEIFKAVNVHSYISFSRNS